MRTVELGERRLADIRMSAVISSGPSLVSAAMQVSSSMWMVVKRSSHHRSEIRIESRSCSRSRHERHAQVLAERELAEVGGRAVRQHVPRAIWSPTFTSGRWLMQVFWFERVYLIRL